MHRLAAIRIFLLVSMLVAGSAWFGCSAQPQAAANLSPEVARRLPSARALIEQAIAISHVGEIYADVKQLVFTAYRPFLQDVISGNVAGVAEVDNKSAQILTDMLNVLEAGEPAVTEMEQAVRDARPAMVEDAAGIVAKEFNDTDLSDLDRIFQLRAVQKTFDAVYALTKLATGHTYDDLKTITAFSAWAGELTPRLSGGMRFNHPPSTGALEKAKTLVDDFLRVSNLDDAVEKIYRFAKETYPEIAELTGEKRQSLIDAADQFKFQYGFQKSIVAAAAPFAIATQLSDEEIDTAIQYVNSDSFARLFTLVNEFIGKATEMTGEDVVTAKSVLRELAQKAEAEGKKRDKLEGAEGEWQAFADKWSDYIEKRVSEPVKNRLTTSMETLQRDLGSDDE